MSENVIEEAANLLERCAECLAPHNLGAAQGARDAAASLRKAAEGAQVRWLDKWSLYDYDRKVPGCRRVLVLPIPEPGKENHAR